MLYASNAWHHDDDDEEEEGDEEEERPPFYYSGFPTEARVKNTQKRAEKRPRDNP